MRMFYLPKVLRFSIFITLLFPLIVNSAEPVSVTPPPLAGMCDAEISKYCEGLTIGTGLFRCLIPHKDEASENCRAEIEKATKALKRSGGLNSFSGVMGNMNMMGSQGPVLTYGGSVAPRTDPTDIRQHKLGISLPVFRNEIDSVSMSLNSSSLRFGERLYLSKNGTEVPSELYKIEVGTNFTRKLENERSIGTRFTVGSASDRPFQSSKDITFHVTGFYGFPVQDGDHWMWTVYASNNSPIINYIPIPGFVYFFRSDKVMGMVGLPFTVIQWMPSELWTYSFSLFGPSVNLEAIYGSSEKIQTFVGFNWGQQSFLRSDRTESRDRLFLDEKKIFTGIRTVLGPKLSAELQIGHAFGRVLYEGPRFEKRDGGSVDLNSSGFVAWNFRYTF
ncbi:MAG: hypothetical protein V4736_12305 [Bdellovibrionota bacterium]